jgi:hypothetical protein
MKYPLQVLALGTLLVAGCGGGIEDANEITVTPTESRLVEKMVGSYTGVWHHQVDSGTLELDIAADGTLTGVINMRQNFTPPPVVEAGVVEQSKVVDGGPTVLRARFDHNITSYWEGRLVVRSNGVLAGSFEANAGDFTQRSRSLSFGSETNRGKN